MTKAHALTFATVPLIGSLLAVYFFMLVIADSEAATEAPMTFRLLLGIAMMTFAFAALVILLLAGNRGRAARWAFVLHAAGAFALFVWFMSESAGGVGALTVVSLAVMCEALGLLSIRRA